MILRPLPRSHGTEEASALAYELDESFHKNIDKVRDWLIYTKRTVYPEALVLYWGSELDGPKNRYESLTDVTLCILDSSPSQRPTAMTLVTGFNYMLDRVENEQPESLNPCCDRGPEPYVASNEVS